MFRFASRRNVKLLLGLGVAVLLLAELVKVAVLVGRGGVTQIYLSAVASKRTEVTWTFQKRWSNGLDEDIEEMNEDGLLSDVGEETEQRKLKFGTKDGKEKEERDPREKEAEWTEEEELKLLEKLLSRDSLIAPDVDKLTGSEKDGTPEEERVGKENESEEDTDEAEKKEMKFLEKMLNSQDDDEGAAETKVKKSEQEDRPMPHNHDKARVQNGGPAKHAVIKAAPKTNSKPKEIKGLKNRKEEQEIREQETDGEPEASEEREIDFLNNLLSSNDGENSERKAPQISKTSTLKKNEANDQIHVNTSRPVVNPHPFRYIISASDVCKGAKVLVLCYVHSAVQNFKRRARVRNTWANRVNYPGIDIRVVFFVGQPSLDTTEGRQIQELLQYESKKHGDIVQESFLESRRNLSHKGVGALKWVSTYCNHTAYVLKTDDDMFVNMYVILNHLRNIYAENFRRRLIVCYVYWRMPVGRDSSVAKGYFPNNIYPPYCSGMGFVVSIDVALALYQVSRYVPFLALDEIFIGGVLPAALQGAVNHTSWARTYCAVHEMGVYTHPTEWYKYTFTHTHDEKLMVKTWRGLSDIVRNRTIPRPSMIRPGHLADEYIPLTELFPPP